MSSLSTLHRTALAGLALAAFGVCAQTQRPMESLSLNYAKIENTRPNAAPAGKVTPPARAATGTHEVGHSLGIPPTPAPSKGGVWKTTNGGLQAAPNTARAPGNGQIQIESFSWGATNAGGF